MGEFNQGNLNMMTTAELFPMVEDLYKRLGGVGNADARLVRELYERLQKAERIRQPSPPRAYDDGRPPGM